MIQLSERAWRELGLSPPFSKASLPEAASARTSTLTANVIMPRETAPATGSKRPHPVASSQVSEPTASVRKADPVIQALTWEEIPEAIESCRACVLHQGRKRSVPGVGDPKARWLFVGEGPGAEEEQRGEPFVGAAGQLLNSMLSALNLSRQHDVYIANVVKCRPPANRTPEITECVSCFPFLERQIALIQPQIIVALGRVAAQSLLNSEINFGSLRNKVHHYGSIPLVVTFHPAYLLRNLPEKAKAWADLCLAQRTLQSFSQNNHS